MDKAKPFRHHFRLKKPCADCPFLLEGAIPLHPGRREAILASLTSGKHSTFWCHTVSQHIDQHDAADEANDPEDDDDGCPSPAKPSDEHAHCYGAAAVLTKRRHPSIMMSVAFAYREADPRQWDSLLHLFID